MPLQRRVPKRGFNNVRFARKVAVVRLDQLNVFESGAQVTEEALRAQGVVKGRCDAVKLLASGEVDRPLELRIHLWSAAAEEKIKAAGGSLAVPEPPGAARKSPQYSSKPPCPAVAP